MDGIPPSREACRIKSKHGNENKLYISVTLKWNEIKSASKCPIHRSRLAFDGWNTIWDVNYFSHTNVARRSHDSLNKMNVRSSYLRGRRSCKWKSPLTLQHKKQCQIKTMLDSSYLNGYTLRTYSYKTVKTL